MFRKLLCLLFGNILKFCFSPKNVQLRPIVRSGRFPLFNDSILLGTQRPPWSFSSNKRWCFVTRQSLMFCFLNTTCCATKNRPCHPKLFLQPPRLELYESGLWGDPANTRFEVALKNAWADFRQWKKTNKISCSQPAFRATSVS